MSLSDIRRFYSPVIPLILQHLEEWGMEEKEMEAVDPEIALIFPRTAQQKILRPYKKKEADSCSLKVGVVFSGGQAPGGHNVIAGVYDSIKKLHQNGTLIGFLNGPSGIIKNEWIEITADLLLPYRNQGGFDLIGSGRTKIETEEQFESAAQTLQQLNLDGLVIIGGDDSNTNAAFLAEYCLEKNIKTKVIGVPKTIDGDLKNRWIEQSFGFDTASKVYAEFVGNICKDALSAKKYYFFIKMMGRSASHLTLEVALQTQVNLALISEEVAKKEQNLHDIVDEIVTIIEERGRKGKNYGVFLIPEGLLEFIPDSRLLLKELEMLSKQSDEKEVIEQLSPRARACFDLFPEVLKRQLFLERDSHGNIQLSKIETERLLIDLVTAALEKKETPFFQAQPLFLGYEGRSAYPSNFDANYCYALGCAASLLIKEKFTGYTAAVENLGKAVEDWLPIGAPIVGMLGFEKRKGKNLPVIKKCFVDVEGKLFKKFVFEREKWKREDLYLSPGPVQFFGPKELCDKTTFYIQMH